MAWNKRRLAGGSRGADEPGTMAITEAWMEIGDFIEFYIDVPRSATIRDQLNAQASQLSHQPTGHVATSVVFSGGDPQAYRAAFSDTIPGDGDLVWTGGIPNMVSPSSTPLS